MTVKSRKIADAVLGALSTVAIDGASVTMPRMDQKLYKKVNDVLEALGGKWNRKEQCHLFPADPTDAIEATILNGEYSKPQDYGFFETPPKLVRRMLELADLAPGMTVLEPSAGRGAIARAAAEIVGRDKVTVVELLHENLPALHAGTDWRDSLLGDFLTMTRLAPGGCVLDADRVIMNPPFARQADIDHVTHAWRFVKPGGRLVAVMSAGVTFRDNSKTVDFRHGLAYKYGGFESIGDGMFLPHTAVRTVLVVLDKPEN